MEYRETKAKILQGLDELEQVLRKAIEESESTLERTHMKALRAVIQEAIQLVL